MQIIMQIGQGFMTVTEKILTYTSLLLCTTYFFPNLCHENLICLINSKRLLAIWVLKIPNITSLIIKSQKQTYGLQRKSDKLYILDKKGFYRWVPHSYGPLCFSV